MNRFGTPEYPISVGSMLFTLVDPEPVSYTHLTLPTKA